MYSHEQVRDIFRSLQTFTMKLFAKMVCNHIESRQLFSQKDPSQITDWVRNVPLSVDTSQFLKFIWGCLPNSMLIASKDGIIWHHFHLQFRSLNYLSISRPLKQLSKISLRWCSQEHLFVKVSANYYQILAVEFIFRKVLCFQQILLNTFRRMCCTHDGYSLRGI